VFLFPSINQERGKNEKIDHISIDIRCGDRRNTVNERFGRDACTSGHAASKPAGQ
jgi:hypothetical protein